MPNGAEISLLSILVSKSTLQAPTLKYCLVSVTGILKQNNTYMPNQLIICSFEIVCILKYLSSIGVIPLSSKIHTFYIFDMKFCSANLSNGAIYKLLFVILFFVPIPNLRNTSFEYNGIFISFGPLFLR